MQCMKAKEIMNQHQLKVTASRESLLHILLQRDKPLSYEDIKQDLEMDKTTFYRNMSTFENSGIVNGFESDDKKRYFEINQNPHAHFICKVCHNIECLKEVAILNLIGYQVDNFILHGTCKSCNTPHAS